MGKIEWKPFNKKVTDYIKATQYNTFNIAHGAIRASKTVANTVSFSMAIDTSPDTYHLASAFSVSLAKSIIGEGNGLGLAHIFSGRSRWGKYKGLECLHIKTPNGEKIVLFAGAGKENSYKSILGESFGCWYATEFNLHHKKFIDTARGRLVASGYRRIFTDQNPVNPYHYSYTDYIDMWRNNDLSSGVNYQDFDISDNLAITRERKLEIIQEYDPDSLAFKRDILGHRVVAEGLIYKVSKDNIITEEDYKKEVLIQSTMAFDKGETISSTSFSYTGIMSGMKKAIVLEDFAHKNADIPNKAHYLSFDDYCKEFVKFVKFCYNRYGRYPNSIYVDAERNERRILERNFMENQLPSNLICYPDKDLISERIRAGQDLLGTGRLLFKENCTHTIEAFETAQYDQQEAKLGNEKRLDDGTTNIDNIDCVEYCIQEYLPYLLSK